MNRTEGHVKTQRRWCSRFSQLERWKLYAGPLGPGSLAWERVGTDTHLGFVAYGDTMERKVIYSTTPEQRDWTSWRLRDAQILCSVCIEGYFLISELRVSSLLIPHSLFSGSGYWGRLPGQLSWKPHPEGGLTISLHLHHCPRHPAWVPAISPLPVLFECFLCYNVTSERFSNNIFMFEEENVFLAVSQGFREVHGRYYHFRLPYTKGKMKKKKKTLQQDYKNPGNNFYI